jgi:hypothetical protein
MSLRMVNPTEEGNISYVVFKLNIHGSAGVFVRGGGVTPPAPTPLYKQASGQISKDDENGFSSILSAQNIHALSSGTQEKAGRQKRNP